VSRFAERMQQVGDQDEQDAVLSTLVVMLVVMQAAMLIVMLVFF